MSRIRKSNGVHKLGQLARLVIVSPALIACGAINAGPADSRAVNPEDWGYWGPGAPNNWGDLSPEFALCATGTRQSPIDLVDWTEDSSAPALSFNYTGSPTEVSHNGKVAHVEYGEGNTLAVGERRYELVSMHIHVHAEHQMDGQLFPAEIHLVHRKEGGFLGVVGQLYRLGEPDPVVQALIDAYPEPGQVSHSVSGLNAAGFVPSDGGYYHYDGSLTTPPCTEGVDWYVLRQVKTISQEQVNRIAALHNGFNHRPIQARNGRNLIYSGPRPG